MEFLFFAAVFLAEIAGTIAGFGSATILLPIALLFLDFKTALVLVAFVHLFGNLGRIIVFLKGLNWRIFTYFGLIGIISSAAGATLVIYIHQDTLKACLGVFLVLYSLFALARPSFRMKSSKTTMLLGGAASGFLAGLIGTGGAVRSAFLTAYHLPKTHYIATAAAIAIVVDGIRIPLYLNDGLLAENYIWMLPILFILAITGSYVGKQFVSKVSASTLRTVILYCLILAGVTLIANFFI